MRPRCLLLELLHRARVAGFAVELTEEAKPVNTTITLSRNTPGGGGNSFTTCRQDRATAVNSALAYLARHGA